jgi:hypothetical protein
MYWTQKLKGRTDDNFRELVDGTDTSFEEINNNSTVRTLSIPFEKGAMNVAIANTEVEEP